MTKATTAQFTTQSANELAATPDSAAGTAPDGHRCMFCQRQIALTFHHLIPRKMHRRPYFQKHYSKTELAAGIWLCQLCHQAVHRCYDEMTLAKHLNSLALLLADPTLQRHVQFAQKQRRQR